MTPYGVNIIVKPYRDINEGLIVPDGIRGELFEVISVGEGYTTENGQLIPLEVKSGDIVAIQGQIKAVPFNGERYLVANASNILCYYREKVDIPEKI